MNGDSDNPVLEVKRVFTASPSAVFDAWMNRAAFAAWIGPEGMTCDVALLEPFVGGQFQLQMKISDDNSFPVVGTYRAIEKPTRIVFSWGRADDLSSQTIITVMLNALGEHTELTLQHAGLRSVESRNAHGRGWNDTFNKLARYLAKN
jgi:uncharacterized protein YndB with AHSA1/START domain